MAPRPDGGQQQRDDLPLPVRRMQLPAGSAAEGLASTVPLSQRLSNLRTFLF